MSLTYGNTFTLPSTGERTWTIRDGRALIATSTSATTAFATSGDMLAHYTPGAGWWMGAIGGARGLRIVEDLNALDVALPERSTAEWQDMYRGYLERDTAGVLTGTLERLSMYAEDTDVDQGELRARIAARAAVVAMGEEADSKLYQSVFTAALASAR